MNGTVTKTMLNAACQHATKQIARDTYPRATDAVKHARADFAVSLLVDVPEVGWIDMRGSLTSIVRRKLRELGVEVTP